MDRTALSDGETGVVVLHVPTGRFLGVALVLVEQPDAISFESADVAEQFLGRHASEPCYDVVRLTVDAAA